MGGGSRSGGSTRRPFDPSIWWTMTRSNRPRWITGGKQFLLLSERDGYDQVYLFNRDGSLVRRVTPGGWDVFEVVGVDEQSKVLYFTGAIDGPLARPLLRIGLDGKSLTRISTEPRSEEHTSELQSLTNLVCRLL